MREAFFAQVPGSDSRFRGARVANTLGRKSPETNSSVAVYRLRF